MGSSTGSYCAWYPPKPRSSPIKLYITKSSAVSVKSACAVFPTFIPADELHARVCNLNHVNWSRKISTGKDRIAHGKAGGVILHRGNCKALALVSMWTIQYRIVKPRIVTNKGTAHVVQVS